MDDYLARGPARAAGSRQFIADAARRAGERQDAARATRRPPAGDRDGETYEARFDRDRLNAQARRVYDAVATGGWLTLAELSAATGDPEASVSARLRDLRKPRFGALTVERRRRGGDDGAEHEYRLAQEVPTPALS